MTCGQKVLIVEDDSIIAGVYRRYLCQAGYEVEIANDGLKALERLVEFRPDAVVLDFMLPHLNGIEVLKKIRALNDFMTLPVLVITTAFVANVIKDSIASGATQVVNKMNFTPPLLVVALRDLLSNAGKPLDDPAVA